MNVRLPTLKNSALSFPALGCLVVIGIVDAELRPRTRSRLLEGLVDETAHAATALLLLGALDPQSVARFGVAAALGGVLIDADHVPMEFWRWDILTRSTGRPYPHSLAAFLGATAVVYRLPAHYRRIGGAVIAGFATHLARDLATGGVPLLWPITDQQIRMPYRLYAMMLALMVSLIVSRECQTNETTRSTLARKPRDPLCSTGVKEEPIIAV